MLSQVSVAACFWFIGMVSVFLLDWATKVYTITLLSMIAGFSALIWQRPPWASR
jgi:hypothetical protein